MQRQQEEDEFLVSRDLLSFFGKKDNKYFSFRLNLSQKKLIDNIKQINKHEVKNEHEKVICLHTCITLLIARINKK